MRLLNTETYEVKSNNSGVHNEQYGILSHRWLGDEEITYQQLPNYTAELRSGERPLKLPQGLRWLWMDTCCIDKTDARDYAEAINAMYSWYRDAALCITYVSDVGIRKDHRSRDPEVFRRADGKFSEWFSRGWTLQELLAPWSLEFYDMDWNYMGTKRELATALATITGIDSGYHTGEKHINEACIAVKMSWMSHRETTYPEDMAYSMIGIFNIAMPVVYGEGGPRAFRRLQEILLSSHIMDESLFAWTMPDANAGRKCEAPIRRMQENLVRSN
ncbi:HET-domain-containing protein [Astrocystis sublimbata]|nr:HET-domain-containing protein [Astrocystis sublimbata]